MGRKKRKKKLAQIIPELLAVYRYFWKDIRKQRRLIVSSMAALAVGVVLSLLEPWPLKFILDLLIKQDRVAGSISLPEHWSSGFVVAVVSIAVVLIAVFRSGADYVSRVGFFNIGNRMVIKIRDRVYRHLQLLPMKFHNKARSGDLIVRVTRDVSLLRDVTATAILPLIASSMVLAGMIGVMFYLSWQLTLISLTILPIYWLSTVRIGRQIRETARKQRLREGAMAAIASEAIGSIRAIKSLSLEAKFADQFDRKNNQSQTEDLKSSRLSLRLERTVDILLAISTAAVLGYGAVLVLDKSMEPSALVVFLVYLKRAFKPAQEFAKYTVRIAKATAAGERVINILEQEPESRDRADAIQAGNFVGAIEFCNLDFGYTKDKKVLSGFNLKIKPGQIVAITGPSGAGKSTILGLLLRLYNPDSGRILIDNQPVDGFSLDSYRRNFSVVLQTPMLFAASIFENIAIGRNTTSFSKADVTNAAQLAQAHEFICNLPKKYETQLGERAATISRGQCQRIAIARAAMLDKSILLLDEPTTGLDEMNKRIVIDALLKLSRGKTTIMVTHNLNLASRADLIVYVDGGKIQYQGTHDELIKQAGLYEQLFRERNSTYQNSNGHSNSGDIFETPDLIGRQK